MDYSELEGFLATAIPAPELDFPPFKVEASQLGTGAYIISLLNKNQDLMLQVSNETADGYEHAAKMFNALESRWNGLAVLLKAAPSAMHNSKLIEHALREFEAMGYQPLNTMADDDTNKLMLNQIIQLLSVFAQQGHSGGSAGYAISAFTKLANFEPLSPLTGEDHEWMPCWDNLYQNKRCTHVFKGADGRAYDDQAKIFREPDGSCYQSADSRVYIEFPYSPTVEYVDVPSLEGVENAV